MSRAVPTKFNGRVSRSKDERAGKTEPKYELMGRSAPGGVQLTPLPAVRNDEQDGAPLLAYFPNPGSAPGAAPPNPAVANPALPNPPAPHPASPQPSSTGLGSSGGSVPVAPSSRADMPLPALSTFAARPDPAPPWQAKEPDPPMLLPQFPVTVPVQPAENPKRPTREAARHTAAPAVRAAPKPAAPSYYTEKYLDQGEYRYRRRLCEPPNMPDVCFMPQADRQPVLARQ
jgi:hypothetical protein